MRVLFAGATGVIGREIVPVLAGKFDLKLAAKEQGTVGGHSVEAADIRDFEQAVRLVKGVDAVVNSVIESPYYPDGRNRETTPEEIMKYHEGIVDANMRGAYHLYEAAARAGVKKFVFISSLTIVLGTPKYERIEASTLPRPRSLYACSKFFGEELGYVYSQEHGMNVICLRLGQPFPTGNSLEAKWLANPRHRGIFVENRDIAFAIECALKADAPRFGVYSTVSDSDSAWIDVSAAAEIGYRPKYRFTAEGPKLIDT
jgi:nucleoside-diphosphate-sugar epimerase